MPETSQSKSSPKILGTFAGLVSILGAILYFTGWIYRWAYFGFFQLEVTGFDLPFESFLFVPLQVFFADFWAFSKTVLAIVAVVLLIQLTLWLLHPLNNSGDGQSKRFLSKVIKYARKLHKWWIIQWLRSFAAIFPQPFRSEIIIVIWVLVALFWLARGQGMADARRDAFNQTSTLPVITLVTPEKRSLGRRPNDLTDNPKPSEFRIIGDLERYRNLLGGETNSPDGERVWRLLIAQNDNFYIFKTLPPNATRELRPLVLVVRGSSDDSLLILSPEATKP